MMEDYYYFKQDIKHSSASSFISIDTYIDSFVLSLLGLRSFILHRCVDISYSDNGSIILKLKRLFYIV